MSKGPSPPSDKQSGPPKRRRRWGRRLVVLLLLVLVAAAVGLRLGALRWAVLPALASAINCDVDADAVRLTASGDIYIENLRLSARNVEPVAATFFEAPYVSITPRWIGLIAGGVPVDSITVRRPTITISQDKNFNINIGGLGGAGSRDDLDILPGFELHDGILVLAEHGGGWVNQLIALRVDGRIARPDPNGSRYTLELTGTQAGATGDSAAVPIHVTGEYDLAARTGSLSLDNLDLARFQDAQVPSALAQRWSEMKIAGSVRTARLTFDPVEGPGAFLTVRDVAMNIPLPDETEAERLRSMQFGPERPRGGLVAMRGVTGELRFSRDLTSAQLHGLIEDLPCRVDFTLRGSIADGALVARITTDEFNIEQRPRLLPYAPFPVKRNFRRFSGPTAMLSGVVDVTREAATPDGPAPLKVAGRIDFTNGEARFEKFAYPFSNLRGSILFDDEKVDIVSITGDGPTGAKLLAKGVVAPPTEGAAVDVTVTVIDVPTDDVLRESVPVHRRGLVDMLMSQEWYDTLLDRGLITGPGATAGDASADVRPFVMGGVGSISVRIDRARGDEAQYLTRIDVNFPSVGLLSRAFPYPVNASDVNLRITDESVSLDVGAMEGLTGARGGMRAAIRLMPPDQRDPFEVRAHAAGVPADGLLLAALSAREGQREPGRLSATALIEGLGIRGVADVSAFVREEAGDPETHFDIDVLFDDLRARSGPGCLTLGSVSGALFISDEGIEAVGLSGVAGGSHFTADVLALPRDGEGSDITARMSSSSFELSEPVEDILRVVAPAEADTLANLRAHTLPRGGARTDALIRSTAAGTEYDVSLGLTGPVAARVLMSEIRFVPEAGTVRVTPRRVEAGGVAGRITVDGVDHGGLSASGVWPLVDDEPGRLSISVPAARLETPFVRTVVSTVSKRLGEILTARDVRGVFAVTGGLLRSPGGGATFDGVIEPRSLAFRNDEHEATFDSVSGRIVLTRQGGRVENLAADADDWSLRVGGGWTSGTMIDADLTLDLDAHGLPADLRALLPERARAAMDSAGLQLTGPLRTENAHLRYSGPSTGGGGMLSFTTAAEFERAELDAGLPLALMNGKADLEISLPMDATDTDPRIAAVVEAVELVASGVPMSEARVRVRSGVKPGTYVVPQIEAQVHGGTLSGTAHVKTLADKRTQFDAEMLLASVDFGSLMRSLGAAAGASPELLPEAPGAAPTARGVLDGSLSLAGVVGDKSSRRGRGDVRVRDGEVVALPGVMPLLRLSNLQPPMGEKLTDAWASFYVRGDTLTFERLVASSPSVLIQGSGEMRVPSTDLTLRFNTRGRMEIPVISDLFRGVRDELLTAVVVGTLAKPDFKMEALPATRGMLGTIFRSSPAKAGAEATEKETP